VGVNLIIEMQFLAMALQYNRGSRSAPIESINIEAPEIMGTKIDVIDISKQKEPAK
jgi:hypothetical protein